MLLFQEWFLLKCTSSRLSGLWKTFWIERRKKLIQQNIQRHEDI